MVVVVLGIQKPGGHTKQLANDPNGVSLWLYDKIVHKKLWQENPKKFGTPYYVAVLSLIFLSLPT